ncbi:low molecular weight protein-tyrosine-phosphatase [Phaeobacter sp. C3_T13_0]|uniref:low molecular weight protein-tyrosine-phosphatase n=1 Tax=Phaeobacter cretensis TaxID=3342641 RepID=UPI0039BCD76A
MTQRVLFVCLGNICRSPAAEGVFRTLRRDVVTDSAGTAGYHIGSPPYGAMKTAAGLRGIDLSDLRARQFTSQDFSRFDLIIAMDDDNLADIEAQRPAGVTATVHLFTDFASASEADHVPDPYYTRDFDGCLDLIEEAARGLSEALR